MCKTILAKPMDHFEALCNALYPLHVKHEQKRKRNDARDYNVLMTKCHAAVESGLMSSASLNKLDAMLRHGVELSPEILLAIDNLPTPGIAHESH